MSSPFNPASPQALATARLFVFVLALGAAVFVIVAGVVVIAAARFGRRAGDGEPPQQEGSPKLEAAWIAGAAALLLVILIPTIAAMRAIDPPAGQGSPDLTVIGHQWWWEVRYPAAGVVTANEIHIPVGRPVLVHLDSADVIHDFWIPQLARKMDMTPGHPDRIWLQASAPGVYLGACAEFCGVEHGWMRLRVSAEPEAAFARWLKGQQTAPAAPAAPLAVAGRGLFTSLTCNNCHTPGVAVGPDLTHLATRETLGAGAIPNTPQDLARWLADPDAVKPGVLMPNFHLTPTQIAQLVAYLETRR